MPDQVVPIAQVLAEAPRYRNAEATAYWGLIGAHALWAVGFLVGFRFDLADIRRGYYGTGYDLAGTASFFAYASGFGLLAAWGIGVLILTEVPEQPAPSIVSLLLLLGAVVAAGALMTAYLGWAPQRLAGLTIIAGYSLAVAATIGILSALGAMGVTTLSVMAILAWSHLSLGIAGFAVFLLAGFAAVLGR